MRSSRFAIRFLEHEEEKQSPESQIQLSTTSRNSQLKIQSFKIESRFEPVNVRKSTVEMQNAKCNLRQTKFKMSSGQIQMKM